MSENVERSRKTLRIAVLPGDGVGAEVTDAAMQIVKDRAIRHGLLLEAEEVPIGGKAIDECGHPLPPSAVETCKRAGTVFLGAVGDSRFDSNPPEKRPERAILGLRQELGLFANLRPIVVYAALQGASTLKPSVVKDVDILFVRELTGGIYFGKRGNERTQEGWMAFDTEIYHDWEIERIARVAFESARQRRFRLISVDKSNVLASSRLWRKVVEQQCGDFADVCLEHMLVDNCAMQLVRDPRQFDVILCSNMFGDILSDEAAMISGSLGMLPSASLGPKRDDGHSVGLYEPVHGSAPDIAGQDKANPLAAILSAALMFRYSFQREDIADEIEWSVEKALEDGNRTLDLAWEGQSPIGTRLMTEAVLRKLQLADAENLHKPIPQ